MTITAEPLNAEQFKWWRILFGVYLLAYSIFLIPHAVDLYSVEGMVSPDKELNWTFGKFPSIFYWLDSPFFVLAGNVLMALAALSFMIGYHRKIASLVYLYIAISFFNKNNLTGDPTISFVYWLLLATVFIPDEKKKGWRIPANVYTGAWIILGTGYFVGGILKLMSPSWRDGSALSLVLSLPNTRSETISNLLLGQPHILAVMTLLVLALELGAPLLFAFKRTRFFAWMLLTGMHLMVLGLLSITQVSIGMLLYHLFLFDRRWIKTKH